MDQLTVDLLTDQPNGDYNKPITICMSGYNMNIFISMVIARLMMTNVSKMYVGCVQERFLYILMLYDTDHNTFDCNCMC